LRIEKDIWRGVHNSDQEAYAKVYRYYYPRFYNYGKKFTSNVPLVEDATQETLMDIWDKREKLPAIEFPTTYFYTSFRYVLFRKLKLQRQIVTGDIAPEEPEFSIDHFIIRSESDAALRKQLENALTTLTPRQREVIFLRFYEGLSYEEVAAILSITTKATYKIMARALVRLKRNIVFSSGFFPLFQLLFPK
jgi:RNA polymerase sigma factor (sigma-70 family)